MRKSIRLLLIAAGVLGSAAPTFAADWALSVDAPLSYTFDKPNTNRSPSGSSNEATWDHRTSTDTSGSKVLLIAPFHVGVGYEDYTVKDTITIPCSGGPPCAGKVNVNLQIADVVLDFPMRFLHFGVGYGMGQANANIEAGNTISIRHANVSQTFVTLGVPLGKSLDVHLGYHWVSVENKDFQTQGSMGTLQTDQFLASGEMLSAGLRFNF